MQTTTSTPRRSQVSAVCCSIQGQSTLWCCLSIVSSVCLFVSLLVLFPVGQSWPVQMILWCARTTLVCVFSLVRWSSYGSLAFPTLVCTSSLVMWSLYEIPISLWKHLISSVCVLLSMSAVMVHVSHAYKIWTWPGNAAVKKTRLLNRRTRNPTVGTLSSQPVDKLIL